MDAHETWLAGFRAWRDRTQSDTSATDEAPYVRHDFTALEAERLQAYKLAVQAGFYTEDL